MEIERKWLLRILPMKVSDAKYWVDQFYLSTEPEIRLKRCYPNSNYANKPPFYMTIKSDGNLSREEIETPVTEEFYYQALDFVNQEPIFKNCLVYYIDGHKVEIAVILNDEKFIYAEVEFESEEEANAYQFPWPDLVEKEVTNDPEYKMKNYWKRIRC